MRKFSQVFGLIVALLCFYGTYGKANHYRGSDLVLILSLFLLLPIYMVFLAQQYFQRQRTFLPIIAPGILLVLFNFGLLFRFEHWPGSWVMMTYMIVLLAPYLLILIILQLRKPETERRFSVTGLSVVLIFISLIYGITFRPELRKPVVYAFIQTNENEIATTRLQTEQNEMAYNRLDPATYESLANLRNTCTTMVTGLELIKQGIAKEANDDVFVSYSDIKRMDDEDLARRLLMKDNGGALIKSKIDLLRESLMKFTLSNKDREQIQKLLSTEVPPFMKEAYPSWEENLTQGVVISCIANLSGLQARVKLAEGIVLKNYLPK